MQLRYRGSGTLLCNIKKEEAVLVLLNNTGRCETRTFRDKEDRAELGCLLCLAPILWPEFKQNHSANIKESCIFQRKYRYKIKAHVSLSSQRFQL
jgi:hypothetical protein